jgi:hypothetical protein
MFFGNAFMRLRLLSSDLTHAAYLPDLTVAYLPAACPLFHHTYRRPARLLLTT